MAGEEDEVEELLDEKLEDENDEEDEDVDVDDDEDEEKDVDELLKLVEVEEDELISHSVS